MMKRNSRFTLLEIMVVVCLLALSGSALAWKAQKWFEREKFFTDVSRFKSFLIGARMSALNTRSDWKLEIVEGKGKATAILSCRENPEMGPQIFSLGALKIDRGKQFVFYSSGKVEPEGIVSVEKEGVGKKEFDLAALFRMETNSAAEPSHPRCLKK